jgi:hypothetical protein
VCGWQMQRPRAVGQDLITISGASAGNGEIDRWFMTTLRKSCTNPRSAILLRCGTSTWVPFVHPEPGRGLDQNGRRLYLIR